MNRVGYARVAAHGEDQKNEHSYLVEKGCSDDVFFDDLEGDARTGILRVLAVVQPGDFVAARSLFRLSPTFSRAQEIVDALSAGRVGLILGSTKYPPAALPALSVDLGMSDEFERQRASVRVRLGVRRAKTQGKGKTSKLSQAQQQTLVENYRTGQHTIAELAAVFNIGKSTAYRILEQADAEVVKQVDAASTITPSPEH